MNERLLIVEDEETLCESLKRVLSKEGYTVDIAHNAEFALEVFEEGFYDIIITDIILPGITGIELLKKVKERLPEQIVILTTAYASLETAVEALRNGAYDYVVKPVMHEEIKQIVKNALRQGALQEEIARLKVQIEGQYDPGMIIGKSPAMQQILNDVKQIGQAGSTVLISGEIGTGKELIARAIHSHSDRAGKPFITVNLRNIPEERVEARLFGYVKGAFQNAETSGKGLFEEANGGTIFLREICDLRERLQAKILKVIEDKEIMPFGGKQCMKTDLRLISGITTNKDLESAVKECSFREDLFLRMNGISLKLPPLRERREDIRPLAGHFIQKYSSELCKTVKGIDDEAIETLIRYQWPGNVRELRNVIERAFFISDGDTIKAKHFPELFPSK